MRKRKKSEIRGERDGISALKREKGYPYRFTSESDERERAMSEEAELPSPAATIVSRRASRSAMPERLKVAARDDSSDDEWDPEEVAGASDEEDSDAEDSGADGGAKRGRVTAHYIVQRSSGLEEHDDRRKSLAEKTWARRSVVAHNVSACGAANFEAVPGRERAAEWEKNMLEFAEDNFNDAGIEVRTTCC